MRAFPRTVKKSDHDNLRHTGLVPHPYLVGYPLAMWRVVHRRDHSPTLPLCPSTLLKEPA